MINIFYFCLTYDKNKQYFLYNKEKCLKFEVHKVHKVI